MGRIFWKKYRKYFQGSFLGKNIIFFQGKILRMGLKSVPGHSSYCYSVSAIKKSFLFRGDVIKCKSVKYGYYVYDPIVIFVEKSWLNLLNCKFCLYFFRCNEIYSCCPKLYQTSL